MGMQQAVSFASQVPTWSAVCEALTQAGCEAPGMRMIDGDIALPDEQPPDAWHELRVAWPNGAGMVTVKRAQPQRLELVVWGNADEALQRGWHWLTWAFASAGNGHIEANGQAYDDAAAFAQAVGIAD